MSNRIDFFQSAQTQLALPASSAPIFLDGTLCPNLEVIKIVRSGWPEFSWARFTYNPAACSNVSLVDTEEIDTKFAAGKSICICQVYNGVAPGAATFSFPLFAGQIEGIETELGPQGDKTEIIARDFSANLRRVTVYGQRVYKLDGSSLFLVGADT